MDEEGGFIIGIIVAFFICMLAWHLSESTCQQKHNVHDCVFSGFEPREIEQNDTE